MGLTPLPTRKAPPICRIARLARNTQRRKAMHMRKVILLLLALLPTPAMATVTPDALRELVMAGDVAAVQAALAEAVAQDAGLGGRA